MKRIMILALAGFAVPAYAQDNCMPRDEMVAVLSEEYAEAPLMQMLGADGMAYEVWGNPATGTWTIVRTDPDMRSCPMADGAPFEVIPYVATGAPA